jgi:fatty acid desaturase
MPSAVEIRQRIKNDLPAEAFERVPSKALLLVPLVGTVGALVYLVHRNDLSWYWLAAVSIVLGQIYATSAFLAHEISHGSVVRSKRLSDFLAYFGLYPFLVSPHLWRVWHVQAHHGRTNTERDPDVIVNLDEYRNTPLAKLWTRFVPCSRQRIAGTIFFFYWFTLHGQNILWFHRHYKHWDFNSYSFSWWRAIAETIGYLFFWVALLYTVGWYKGMFVVIIPMMIGNVILLSFIATEHTCLPRSEVGDNHPLRNSVSARVPWLVDKLNLNFSNHVEHHLFPSMNYKHTSLVREWLRQNMKEHYLEPSLLQSFRALFGSPRIYCDNEHLCYPDDVDGTKMEIKRLRGMLTAS